MSGNGQTLPGAYPDTLVADLIARAGSPDYEDWWSRVSVAGHCTTPVHLLGTANRGQRIHAMARCKDRRAANCPSCSLLYAADTWHLVRQGIPGPRPDSATANNGSPDSEAPPVASGTEPPETQPVDAAVAVVFATLTAPGYGAVHSRRHHGGLCHPANGRGTTTGTARRSGVKRCVHGRATVCRTVHVGADPLLGQPLCRDCYDYTGQVLFTWHAPGLWHRFAVGLRRALGRHLKSHGHDRDALRISYVKIVELQRRGVPHFHAIIRADRTRATSKETEGAEVDEVPGPDMTPAVLAELVREAARSARLEVSGHGGEAVVLRFGAQIDVQPIPAASARKIAGYLAKYVTKSVADLGLTSRRLSPASIDQLEINDHLRTILDTILALAQLPGHGAMATWLHTLGYRGHVTSKTRRYSTTMTELRERRRTYKSTHGATLTDDAGADDGAAVGADDEAAEVVWVVTGRGLANDAERLLAATAARKAIQARIVARESGIDP